LILIFQVNLAVLKLDMIYIYLVPGFCDSWRYLERNRNANTNASSSSSSILTFPLPKPNISAE